VGHKTVINEIGALDVQTEQHPKGLEMIGIAEETICERCLKDVFKNVFSL